MFRGLAAIIEAYLIYWAVVYYVARKYFGFSREWAAPLASGISICGVSAAIATGGAIRARPIVADHGVVAGRDLRRGRAADPAVRRPRLPADEPMVAAAWMGLAVKTDGAAVASGAITEALISPMPPPQRHQIREGLDRRHDHHGQDLHRHLHRRLGLRAGLHLDAPHRAAQPGDRLRVGEIWERFPKFVLGFAVTFVVVLLLGLNASPASLQDRQRRHGPGQPLPRALLRADLLHHRPDVGLPRLWAEGIGRLAAVYVVTLFGFIIWVGLVISWIFFHGVKPPIAG